MNPQSLNPYVYCMNNPMKYIDPDGQLGHEAAEWNFDSLYLTWQDMWDASHSDDRNDHWDPDKSPSKREHHRSEIWDFPIDAVGIELSGSFAELFGISGSITFIIDENGDFKIFATEYAGMGFETPGGSARLVFSSLTSEELVNATDLKGVEIEFLVASAQASGDLSGPIPQTLHIGFGYSYPFGIAGVKYDYIRSYVIYD